MSKKTFNTLGLLSEKVTFELTASMFAKIKNGWVLKRCYFVAWSQMMYLAQIS